MADKFDQPLIVHIPRPDEERTSWKRVGVIAAVGFLVGIIWPKAMGVRLGPNAPGDSNASSRAATSAPAPNSAGTASAVVNAPGASIASIAANPTPTAPSAPATAAAVVPVPPTIQASRGMLISCKSKEGETHKGADCGTLSGLDPIAQAKLRKLADCPAAAGVTGKLSVFVTVDLQNGRVGTELHKGTTIPTPDAIFGCVRSNFFGMNIKNVSGENARYTLLYSANLLAPNNASGTSTTTPVAAGASAPLSPAPAAVAPTPSNDGQETTENDSLVQVVWPVALVRDTPRTGQVVARLQRGARLRLTSGKDGWYRVKYGTDFGAEGWVYRAAIGK